MKIINEIKNSNAKEPTKINTFQTVLYWDFEVHRLKNLITR
ncbi:hypothetical protein [Chryseobacterium vrystaatense]|nr:hypothetical protein [Chryseobacterium vrystaatense]